MTSYGMPPQIWRAFEKRYGVSVVEWWGTMEGELVVRSGPERDGRAFGEVVVAVRSQTRLASA